MQVIIVGTDVPDITAEVIASANAELDANDISLGPSEDGGYYLIAMSQPHHALFQNIQWSTCTVRSATQDAANNAGLKFAQETSLPRLKDIDFFEVRNLVLVWMSAECAAEKSNAYSMSTDWYAGLGSMGAGTPDNRKPGSFAVGDRCKVRYRKLV
jgi:glycosyltransferase A (GT-A) superfamily protein (DUF2064 family)